MYCGHYLLYRYSPKRRAQSHFVVVRRYAFYYIICICYIFNVLFFYWNGGITYETRLSLVHPYAVNYKLAIQPKRKVRVVCVPRTRTSVRMHTNIVVVRIHI